MRVGFVFVVVLSVVAVSACRERDRGEGLPGDGVDVLDPRGATQPVMRTTDPVLRATQVVRLLPRQRIPAAPDVAGRLSNLADTTWRAGDFTFVFEPGGHIIVRGGHFDEIAPAGVPGRVVNRAGVLTFDILGRTTYGTWDGKSLTIDRATARRLDNELARIEPLVE